MANPSTRSTYGATFKYGSPQVTVGHVIDIDPPAETMQTSEVDYHDENSTEVIPGNCKSGPLTVTIGFDAADSDHTGIRTIMKAKTLTAFEVGIPNITPAKTLSCTGYFTSFKVNALPATPTHQTATIVVQADGGGWTLA